MSTTLLPFRANLAPIPLDAGTVSGWQQIPIKENGEPLTALGAASAPVYTSSIYFGERTDSPYYERPIAGSLIKLMARESVAERLAKAKSLLPANVHILVFDAFRTQQVQQALYEHYATVLHTLHPDWSEAAIHTETQKYVSLPSTHPERPSPHSTGGALDVGLYTLKPAAAARADALQIAIAKELSYDRQQRLLCTWRTLIAEQGQLLEFGTPFDHGSSEAALAHFERQSGLSRHGEQARDNRRLLYHAMTGAGFAAYADEWWHYNAPESQMGAAALGIANASFGGIGELDAGLLRFDTTAKQIWHRAKQRSPKAHHTAMPRAAEIAPHTPVQSI